MENNSDQEWREIILETLFNTLDQNIIKINNIYV